MRKSVSLTKRRFPRSGDTGHRDKNAERNFGINCFQIIPGRAGQFDHVAVGIAATFRCLDLPRAGEILPGDRSLCPLDFIGRSAGDDLAAMNPRAGAEIDHIVGRLDRLAVMLHHQHRVADIAKFDTACSSSLLLSR